MFTRACLFSVLIASSFLSLRLLTASSLTEDPVSSKSILVEVLPLSFVVDVVDIPASVRSVFFIPASLKSLLLIFAPLSTSFFNCVNLLCSEEPFGVFSNFLSIKELTLLLPASESGIFLISSIFF